jgi:8-oxo-dGTP pyrophosphatase MutT (NUDIX family)
LLFHDLSPLHHAIVAVVEDGDELLLVQRASTDTYPGYWSAVTGAMESDESQQGACIRECREEVGLIVQPVRKVWESVTRRAHFVLHWWQCELTGPRAVVPDPSEVDDHNWITQRDLPKIGLMFSDARWFFREIYPRVRR